MVKKFFLLILIILALVSGIYFKRHQNKDTRQELSLWTIQLKPVAQDIILENIKTFELNNPDFKVTWVDIPIAEAQKRTLASVLGANPPDLVNLNPDFSVLLAQRGALEFFSEDDTKDFLPSAVEMMKFEGKTYGLPFYATSSITLYNKNAFEKCRQNVPKTYDEMAEIAPALKNCTGVYPFAINLNENDSLSHILNKYGVFDFHTDEKIKIATDVYNMFDKMYKTGAISKDALTINHREMAEKYMSNNALLVVIGSNFLNMVKENAPETYSKSDISLQLTSNGGKYDVALMNFIIPKRAKHKAEALELLKLITSENSQIELSKRTNVLPVNKFALQDEYFKDCTSNLAAKARCTSILQLNNIQDKNFGLNNKKAINEAINSTVENVLIKGNGDILQTEKQIRNLADKVNYLSGN